MGFIFTIVLSLSQSRYDSLFTMTDGSHRVLSGRGLVGLGEEVAKKVVDQLRLAQRWA